MRLEEAIAAMSDGATVCSAGDYDYCIHDGTLWCRPSWEDGRWRDAIHVLRCVPIDGWSQ